MSRPTTRYGLLPAVLFLSGCGMLAGDPAAGRRITAAQLGKVQAGMTVAQVRAVLGRPWQVVVDGLGGDREVHQYRMDGEQYLQEVRTYDVEQDVYVTDTVKMTQTRVVELTFAAGKLVTGRR